MRVARILSLACVLLSLLVGGCGGSPSSSSSLTGANVFVTINAGATSVPVNGTAQYSATVSGSTTAAGFGIANGGQAGSTSPGTITSAGLFTAPATPPIYVNGEIVQGAVQGSTTIYATVPSFYTSATSPFINVAILAPQVTAGIAPATASVALGAAQKIYPYAVGNLNGGFSLQVNGVANGNSTVGTITSTISTTIGTSPIYSITQYTYTAPATMPMSGSTVTLTIASAADPTKTGTAVITLH